MNEILMFVSCRYVVPFKPRTIRLRIEWGIREVLTSMIMCGRHAAESMRELLDTKSAKLFHSET